jgi:hypothetical protein
VLVGHPALRIQDPGTGVLDEAEELLGVVAVAVGQELPADEFLHVGHGGRFLNQDVHGSTSSEQVYRI